MLKGAKQGTVWETESLAFTGLPAFDEARELQDTNTDPGPVAKSHKRSVRLNQTGSSDHGTPRTLL